LSEFEEGEEIGAEDTLWIISRFLGLKLVWREENAFLSIWHYTQEIRLMCWLCADYGSFFYIAP
jgi:hypothetical protein